MTGRESILLFQVDNGVARVTLNRPRKRNALNPPLLDALLDALRRADSDDDVRVVTIEGAGADFCAGMDLAALQGMAEAPVLDNLRDAELLADVILSIRRARKPVLSLVRGRALAGGCGIATACDLVLASAGASFGYTEVRIGFVPAMVMAILRRSTSEKRAFELIATGDVHSAEEMERLGLINRIYPDDVFDVEARRFVAGIAERSGSALWLAKRLFHHQDGMTFEAAIRSGVDTNVIARMTEDTREGVGRFLDRRRERG
jgi:methylglutaconyl-CoA hydratase